MFRDYSKRILSIFLATIMTVSVAVQDFSSIAVMAAEVGPGIEECEEHAYVDGVCTACGAIDPDYVNPGDGSKGAGGSDDTPGAGGSGDIPGAGGSGDIPGAGDLAGGSPSGDNHGDDDEYTYESNGDGTHKKISTDGTSEDEYCICGEDFYCELCGYEWDMDEFPLLGAPVGMSPFSLDEYEILVNGTNIAVDASHNIKFNTSYGSSLTYVLKQGGAVVDASDYDLVYALKTDADALSENIFAAFDGHDLTSGERLIPGEYYVTYSLQEGGMPEDVSIRNYGIKIIKSPIAKVTDLKADETLTPKAGNPNSKKLTALKVEWTVPTKDYQNNSLDEDIVQGYSVDIYKKGNDVAIASLNSDDNSTLFNVSEGKAYCNIYEVISTNGFGEYSIKVKAYAKADFGDDRYSESDITTLESYEYKDLICPEIADYTAIYDSENDKYGFKATLTDNVGVEKYAFTTSSTSPVETDAAWKTIDIDDGNATNYELKVFSEEFESKDSGSYYLHVMDQDGNIVTSTNTNFVTKVTLEKHSLGQEDIDYIFLGTVEDNAGMGLDLPTDVEGSGLDFEGWYENETPGDGDSDITRVVVSSAPGVTSLTDKTLTIPAGVDKTLHAKWASQNYEITYTSSVDVTETPGTMVYNGSGDACGLTITAKLGNKKYPLKAVVYDSGTLTYEWYQKHAGEDILVATHTVDSLTDTLHLTQVSESGTYYAKVTFTVNDSPQTVLDENAKEVAITRAPLSFTIKDKQIGYGDPIPTDFEINEESVVGLMTGDSVLDQITGFVTTYNVDSPEYSKAGDYSIYSKGTKVACNYDVSVTNGTLTVGRKDVEAVESGITLKFYDRSTDCYSDTYEADYTGSDITPDIVAFYNDVPITNEGDSQYTLSYESNTNATTEETKAYAVASFDTTNGNFRGELKIPFEIKKVSFAMPVVMKKSDGTIISDSSLAVWTYGETSDALIPIEQDNPTSTAAVFYYAPKSAGTTLNRSTATTTQPVDAGDWYVWGYVPETYNHTEVVSDPFEFHIEKRTITLTAASHVGVSAFQYNGKVQADDGYTQTGTFAYSDAFKSVTVSGAITDVGTVDNIISYELTPTTTPDNYQIITNKGTLEVKPIILTTPSGLAWSDTHIGTLEWTPISQNNLTVEYQIDLYREGTASPIASYTTESAEHDFADDIRTDSEANGAGEYYAKIKTMPKAVSGEAYANYRESSYDKSTSLYTTKLVLDYSAAESETTVENAYFIDLGNGHASRYVICGETVSAQSKSKDGYNNAIWECDSTYSSYVDIFMTADLVSAARRIRFNNPGCVIPQITIYLTAKDSAPVIKHFTVTNSPDTGYDRINYDFEVFDYLGLEGYALIDGGTDKASELRYKITNGTYPLGTLTPFGEGTDGRYTVHTTGIGTGHIYLVVKDTSGNVTVSSDDEAVYTYSITFNNGKADAEDPELFAGEMSPIYKVANTSIKLPDNGYTKIGYDFKNWSGEAGIYNDKASYAANMSTELTAQWTNSAYPYTVNYYYMDTEGHYPEPESPTESKRMNGSYNAVIRSTTGAVQQTKVGFTLDTSSGKVNEVTLGTDENPVVNVYYSRNKYKITYKYEDPTTSTSVSEYDSFYYEQEYTVREPLSLVGYTFVGWSIANFDTDKECTMPARDLEATGSFTADVVKYYVNFYFQNLPTSTGSIAGGDYSETKSEVYTLDSSYSVAYLSRQGAKVYVCVPSDIKTTDLPDVDGFTLSAVTLTKGGIDGTSKPTSDDEYGTKVVTKDTNINGTVDAAPGNTLYVNYYYDRNDYDVTLTVWKDKRDVVGNDMYSKTWRISYGRPFTSVETLAMENFGYSETLADNQWINNAKTQWVDAEGNILEEFKSYELANYTNWSSGAEKPTSMPAGDVAITKEYVLITTAQYNIEFYMQTIDKDNNAVYPVEPTYSVHYYEAIGKNVEVKKEKIGEEADTPTNAYLYYDDIGKMLDTNFESYIYDEGQTNVTSGVVVKPAEGGTGELVLKLYFKRAKMPVTITYQYLPKSAAEGGEAVAAQKIVSYDVWAEWGTHIQINPTEYFYENSVLPAEADRTTDSYINYSDIVGTPIYTDFKLGTASYSVDYNSKPCEISYSGFTYIKSRGNSWPNHIYTAEAELYDAGLATFKTIDFEVGQGKKGADNRNRLTITYSELAENNTYYMNETWGNPNPPVPEANLIIEALVPNGDGTYYQIARFKDFDENGVVQYSYKYYGKPDTEVGAVATEADYNAATKYYIRIANKKDIFKATGEGSTSGTSKYKAETYISNATQPSTYDYSGGLRDGYSEITVTTQYGTGSEYYLKTEDGKNYIYIANLKNNFFAGNYVYFNAESPDYCSNAAKLGFTDAWTRRINGYDVYDENTYNIHQNIYEKMWDHPDNYTFSQVEKDRQTIYLQFGTKSTAYSVTYGTVYNNPYNDTHVTATFSVDPGYRIVWYEDSEYKKPVNESTTYIANKKLNFYGRREKDLVTSYDFISYELSAASKTKLSTVESYVNQINYESFFGDLDAIVTMASSPFTGSGIEVVTDTIERTYIAEDSETSKKYIANRYKLYVDGSLVMAIVENKSLSYSTISLPYHDYEEAGFEYSEKDKNNISKGYVQKDGINLCAYYYRNSYNLSVIQPSTVNDQHDASYDSVKMYEDDVVLSDPTKKGYTFDGWSFIKISKDGTETSITSADLAKYVRDDENKKTSFIMPAYDLRVEAKWRAASFDYDIISYFQQAGGTYEGAISGYESITKADASNITLNLNNATYGSDNNAKLYKNGDIVVGASLDLGGNTYFFINPTVEGDTASVTSAKLVAAKSTEQLTTAESYSVRDYKFADTDLSVFSIFSYAFTTYVSETENLSLSSDKTFTALPDMTLNYFYDRSVSYKVRIGSIASDATADKDSVSGLDITGAGNDFHYGDEATLVAVLEPGYEFKGWYYASDVLPGEYTGADVSDLNSYCYVDSEKLKSAVAISSVKTTNDQGREVYTAKPEITDNVDFIAVATPVDFTTITVGVTIKAGRTDYTYGYAASTENYLQAQVSIPDEYKDKVSVTGYQWYEVEAADAAPTEHNLIPGANSATYLVPTGMNAGNHFYQCVVTLKRTDNGREGHEHAASALNLVVKKYGESADPDHPVLYHNADNYEGIYDGASHSISLRMKETGMVPNKYEIYYSESPMPTWEEVEAGLNADTPTVFHEVNNTIPDRFRYTDVLLDEGGAVASRTVYYYIRTEDDALDPNFQDAQGSNTVTIKPVVMTMSRTTNAFSKVYDAKENVTGSDYTRLLKGDGTKQFFRLNNGTMFESESDNLTLSFDANFNSMHVDDANAVILSNICVKYKTGDKAGQVNPNYAFTPGYTCSLSGYITAYPLHLVWSSVDSFVYDGALHARETHLKDGDPAPPDADLEIISIGAQANVGSYTATASLNTVGKTYKTSDYSFDITTAPYSITACPITVSPKDTTYTYNRLTQKITEYEITGGGGTYVVSPDGTSDGLYNSQNLVMTAIKNDKGRKEAGTETVTTVAGTVKIYESGKDVTYNYNVTYGSGTLTINKKSVTLTGATGVSKQYDGNTSAELLSMEKTIDGTPISVLAEGAAPSITAITPTGVITGDEVFIDSSKTSSVLFADKNVGDGKSISFSLSADSLVGADADNYELDVTGSTLTANANITKQQILVKVKDLSAGTIYGETPAFEVEYSGFKGGDTSAVITGSVTYMLTDTTAEGSAVEVSTYYDSTNSIYKIPVITDGDGLAGYALSLKLDSDGYVDGLSADDYCFVPYAAPYIQETYEPKLVITKREISVTGKDRAPVITKTYDGDTDVDDADGKKMSLLKDTDYELSTQTGSGATAKGLLPGDAIDITCDATYNSANVSDASQITATNLKVVKASEAVDASNNYVLTSDSFSVSGTITPKDLTVTAVSKTITYGDAAPTYTATATGFVGAGVEETQTLTNGSGITLTCAYVNEKGNDNRVVREYEIVPSALTNTNYNLVVGSPYGKLTVGKKEIVVTTEEQKVIYGMHCIPDDDLAPEDSNYTKTFTGWISAYDETADSVLGTAKSNVTATLERTAEDDADASAGKHNANAYPYKADGYKVNVGPISGSELTTDNYSFKYVPGKLMVYRQYISVHNIKTEPKVYDGKTNVTSFDLSDVTFTCYASNISEGSTYTAAQLLPSGANIAANLEVTGTYDNKKVGTGKTVTLNLKLKEGSYLDSRYTLIEPDSIPSDLAEYGVAGAEASQGTTTDGEITKKPLTIHIYYADKVSPEIKYGESIDTTKFGWYDVAPYEFVTVDGVKEGLKELNGQIGYDIVNASGDSYTTTSPVGTYYVKYTGNLSDDGTNYALTIIGNSATVTANPNIAVNPNTLATPAPVWSETNPGTITWNEITGYGEVNVKEYSVKLYKNDGSTIDPATASPLASQTVAATADRKVDFASTIRSEGPGAYKVYIEALAETGAKNPVDHRNVLDSAWGESVDIYAANVIVSYSGSFGTADAVTQGAISGAASKIEINSVAYDTTKSTYCMISGETAPVSASWINVDGYNTGYTRRNIVSDQTDEVAISNISDNSSSGAASFDVKVTLTKKDDVNIKLALDKRPATITGTIEAIRGEAYYGFENGLDPAADPSYRMNATPSALDNLTLSGDVEEDWPYTYKYTWTYGSGISLTGTTETNGKREIIVSATPIIPAKTYNIKCVVKATRKDNGETITGTYYLQNGMKILKAVIGDATAKASVADWTYGEARQIPTLTRVSGGVLPDGIGTVHYYFRKGVLSSWQEWTSTVYPQNVGTYDLRAKIDGNDNYDSFNTDANTTTFTINATKLNKHTDNSTALTASDLKMMSTSKAPYGLATFKAAYGPKENTDSTTNFITPSYEVILYEGSIGSGTQKKKYTSEVNIALDGTGSVDVSDDMNHKGEYYFTVQAISDNTDNCENSDVFTSPVIKVYDNLVVKSEKTGSELAKTAEDGKYHYTYDGSNVVIEMTAGVEGTTNYKWFKDSVEIEGASGATNSSYKVRYVDGSGYYSCQITVAGQTYESSTVYVQIDPRQLTIATGTAEKNYDGTPLTKDEWWVVDSDGTSSSTKAASSGSVVEVATNNDVSGISVTGTKTNVSVDAQNTITTSDNTYDLSGLVIKEPARTENGNVETTVYNASMASAGKANYTFADNLGTLKINKAKLTITSGTAVKSYDGSPLVKHTCETGVTGEGDTRTDDLLSGDHVETINYTGTITNVYYVDGAVSSVDNTFDGVQIVNTGGTDVTDSYDITNVYGKLTITPRSSDVLSAEITNAKAGTHYDFDWTGSNITPTVLVKYGAVVLVEGTDYTLSGDTSKKAVSTANTITVTLKGNYSGTKTLNWNIMDIMNPTGKIKFSSWDTTWSELLEKITFGLYQNDNVTVTVSAKEESGGSGIADVKYYVDYKSATDGVGVLASTEYTTLTQAGLEALGDSVWSAPTGVTTGAGVEETSGTFEIAKDTLKQAVVYARIKDVAGHTTYICSNGLVIDSVVPAITGTAGDIASNTTYCLEKEFTVTDRYLSKVEILDSNGVNIKTVSRSATDTSTTDGFSFDATGVSYTYKLVGDPKNTGAAGTTYTIKATDLAGNVTTLTGVRVNSDHTWNYVGNNTEKLTANCTVDGCTHHSATDITVEISATGGDFIDTPYPATVTVSDKFTNVEASPAGAKVYTAGTVGTVKYYKTTTENAISGGMICSGAPKNAGFYYAECNITGKNGQSLRVVKPFTINQVALKSVSVANSALIYTGSVLNPGTITVEATVNGSDRVLVLDTDYTLTNDVSAKKQTSATKVGTYTVEAIANPNGNYYGNVTCTYTITDNVIPEFSSDIADGGIYCKDKDFAASDATLKEVTILVKQGDGTYAEDSTAYAYVPTGSTATTWNYRLYGTPEGREFKITIADESNNTKTINVKVFDDHKFVTYTDIGVDAGRSGLTEANCENGCGAKDYAREFWGEVKWNYAYSYTLADGLAAHDGVQNVGERATYARVELLRDDVVIATRYVNCNDICGTDAASPADDTTGHKVEFSFAGYKEGNPTAPESECTDVLLRETPDGVHYIYSIRVTPIKDETSTGPARDFNVIPNKYYGSRGDLGDVFSITYNPNCFNVPWKVTLKGIPEEVAPDTIYVKVLYATYADAKDNEYNIITQQNTGTGYACTQHVAEDGSYYYVGSYPVWQYIAGTTNSYYHRIQVVGYDSVDVSAMGYRSICDADHVNHTIYFAGTGASGTILYEVRGLSLAGVPLVVFDENGGTITSAQSSILLENVGDDLTADQINAVTASRGGYKFAGWYDAPSGGNRITSLENVTDSVTLYAHWSLIPPPRHDDPSDDDPGQNPSNPGGPQNPGPQGPKNPDEPGNAGGLPGSGISTPIAPPTNAPSPAQDDTDEDKKLVKTPTNGDKPDGSNPSGSNPSGNNPNGNNPSGNNPDGKNPSGGDSGDKNTGIENSLKNGNLEVIVEHIDASENATDKNNNPGDGNSGNSNPGKGSGQGSEIITADLPNPSAVADAVLTEKEKKLLEDGGNIIIRLIVDDKKKKAPTEEENPGLARLLGDIDSQFANNGEKAIFKSFVDLRLEKSIDSAEWERILSTGEAIDVVINLPDAYVLGAKRAFLARRDGSGYVILEDLDDDPNTITINTNDFDSEYVLVTLEDEEVPLAGFLPENCFWHWFIVATALVWLILILITLKKRKEEEDENADLGENTNLDMNSISAAGISGSTPVTSGYGVKGKYDESELEELAKKSRNRRWLALLPYAILIVVFTILGDCKWEIPCDVIGTLVVGVADYATWKHKFKEADKEERR